MVFVLYAKLEYTYWSTTYEWNTETEFTGFALLIKRCIYQNIRNSSLQLPGQKYIKVEASEAVTVLVAAMSGQGIPPLFFVLHGQPAQVF